MTVITVAQQKGGVGKTTTAMALAVIAGRADRRVLAVDTDPQFTLTRQLGIDVRSLPVSLVDVLTERVSAADAVVGAHGVDVLPARRELSGVEPALVNAIAREQRLAEALADLDYELTVIDTPPNLGLLTVNALMCADTVVAPVAAGDEGAAQGLADLQATLWELRRLRATPPTLVVAMTKWDARRVMSGVLEQAITDLDPSLAPVAYVPMRSLVERAAVERVPVPIGAPDSAPALAYHKLAERLELV